MTSIADRMGLGPRRELHSEPDGGATVYVTPRAFVGGGKMVSVRLSADEIEGYERWRNGALIQTALPRLSEDDCEKLITGLDQEAWKAIMRDEEVE